MLQETIAERIKASPVAKAVARISGVDLHQIAGSGPQGRILKADVEMHLEGLGRGVAPAAPEAVARPGSGQPHSIMRKTIARRLVQSKQSIPHFYLTASVDMEDLLAARTRLNGRSGAGYKLSINDFIIRASAFALSHVPEANAMWTDDAIVPFTEVDVAVAVAVENGILTPVIRNADRKGLAAISDEMRNLAERARGGRLRPEQYQGGGFSISNLGMFGVEQFAAIINPPQSCILAVGAVERRAVVREDAIVMRSMMTVTLSVDHRSVDGAVGARLLAAIKGALEDPVSMIL